ncbi:MAG: hypothetical protein K0S79_731 [Nitrospira sp.]|nr:hypothetical protein [Nitrospira sp.]
MRHVKLHLVGNPRIPDDASRPSTTRRRESAFRCDPRFEGSLVYRRRRSSGNEQAYRRHVCNGKMAFETQFESGVDYSPFARRNPWARP